MSRVFSESPRRWAFVSLIFIVSVILVVARGGGSLSQVSAPTCGNGTIEAGEACDDGNLLNNDGCSSTCTVEQECYDTGNTFSFFVWSDSYTNAGDSGVLRMFDDVVNRSKYPSRVIPRFWLSTGDIPFMADGNSTLDDLNDEISNSSSGNLYPFLCSASNGKFPYFVAIGNHDVDGYTNMTPQTQYNYWHNYVGPKLSSTLVGIKNFQEGPHASDSHDARTTYSFDYKNAHFVVVNQYHGDPAYPTPNPRACIRQDLYDWLAQDLTQTTKPIKFVFGHAPAWSYCSTVAGYGGNFCPTSNIDNLNPANRPRPYSTTGSWDEPFGGHWGDSLEASQCPNVLVNGVAQPGRDAFWSLLANRRVIAHFNGHTHTYSSRLVKGDGTRQHDNLSAYGKTGQQFDVTAGVWGVESGQVHNSAGAAYVLTTVRDNVVTFEGYDQAGNTEPFKRIETWSVAVGIAVNVTSPLPGAIFTAPADSILVSAQTSEAVAQVAFYANATQIGVAVTSPYQIQWNNVSAGTYQLTAVATNIQGATSTSPPVSITVAPPNQTPVLAPISNKSVNEQVLLNFTASATDSDSGQTITYSLVGAPSGASINATSGVFSWTPTEAQGPGTYTVTVVAKDNGTPVASAQQALTITVNEVNRVPVLAAISNKSISVQSTLTFTASATDPDLPANTLTYSLLNAPSGANINATSGVFSWTPTAAGSYTFTVVVTDNGTPPLSAQRNVTVTVTPSPTLPPAPTGLTATGGNQQVSLNWTASASATSYTVFGATTNGGPYSQIASGITATSYLNTGLTNGTTYYYVVTAVNSTGSSGNSNQASATPQLSLPAPGITFIKETGKKRTNTAASVNGSFSTLPSIGNNIVVVAWAWVNVSSGVTLSASDNQGHTYTKSVEKAYPVASGTIVASIFVARVTASSGTFTVTVRAVGGTSRQVVFDAREYSGMLDPTPTDKTSSSQGTANNVDTLATTITAEANELVVAVGVDSTGSSSTTWTINQPGSNPTNFVSIASESDDNNYMAGNAVEVVASSAGAVRHIWTTTPATTDWAAVIASFRRQP